MRKLLLWTFSSSLCEYIQCIFILEDKRGRKRGKGRKEKWTWFDMIERRKKFWMLMMIKRWTQLWYWWWSNYWKVMITVEKSIGKWIFFSSFLLMVQNFQFNSMYFFYFKLYDVNQLFIFHFNVIIIIIISIIINIKRQ